MTKKFYEEIGAGELCDKSDAQVAKAAKLAMSDLGFRGVGEGMAIIESAEMG